MNAPTKLDLFECPALVGIRSNQLPSFVRVLSAGEQALITSYTKDYFSNQKRFRLFNILNKNYAEWAKYTMSLLKPQDGLSEDETVDLDRLLMNFFTSARSLLDHFKQHYVQTFRGTDKENGYAEYITKLETNSWAFAFFQDMRNFTQHCGLPVGHYTRSASRNDINLKIIAKPSWLLQNYKNWDKCQLEAKAEADKTDELDLIMLTQEYWVRLNQDFALFVANAFIPPMRDAHSFFAALGEEVQAAHPGAAMAIAESCTKEGNNLHWACKYPPSDLIGSLGVKLTANLPITTAETIPKSAT